jgi:PST family polysaccharide transporter
MEVGRMVAAGGAWMIGARLLSRTLDLVSMLVLARVLQPRDFGLVAIAMTIVFVLEAVFEMPVCQALVRLPRLAGAHYDTAFTLSLLRGLLLGVAICSISVPFARFYGDPRLVSICCVLSLAPAARGLASPRLADFARRLDFSRDFLSEMIGKSSALVVAVWIAAAFHSYWAIVLGTVASPLIGSLSSYFLAPYKPRLGLAAMPHFSEFLGWITVAQVISAVNWQADRFLLGKLTSRSEMGFFAASNDLSNIPLAALFGPVLRPLNSAFSQLRLANRQLRSSYQLSAAAMVTVALPILLAESILAVPVVRLLFGEKWISAAPMLRWLAISLIPSAFAVPLGPLAMAMDRTSIFVKRNTLEICVKLPLVVAGAIYFRFMGVIFARIVSETVTVAYCMWSVRSLIGIPIATQLFRPWRAFVAAAAMAALLLAMTPGVAGRPAVLPLALHTALAALLALTVYLTVLLALWQWDRRPAGIEAMLIAILSAGYRGAFSAKTSDASAASLWRRRVPATTLHEEAAHD